MDACTAARDAVQQAYEAMGTVVDVRQNAIWQRGGRRTRVDLGSITNPQQKDGESSLQAALATLPRNNRVPTAVAA